MKFSIVTISFNQAQFLEQAIRSVIDQDIDLEYIVVDPGSTDGSREIIERYRDRIDHIVFEPDRGPVDGLNKGFALATGDVLGCLNSDDFYLPGGLKRAEAAIAADPGAGAWTGAGVIVDAAGQTRGSCYSALLSPRRYALRYAIAIHQATFYDPVAFAAVGGFNEESRATWDGELLYWMMRKGYRISRNFEKIGAFRIHDSSITGSGRLAERFEADYARLRADLNAVSSSRLNAMLAGLNSAPVRALIDARMALHKLADRVAQAGETNR